MAPHGARPGRVAPRTRPRYKRISAAAGAAGVTLVSVLGGVGWLPAAATGEVLPKSADGSPSQGQISLTGSRLPTPPTPHRGRRAPDTGERDTPAAVPPVPAASGHGRRVVFDISAQRVWLVGRSGRGGDVVRRSYLASGSLTDNLRPGTYSVFARERHAWGIDNSGTMQYFVAFAHGRNAAIGFHDIPVKDGKPLQSRAELGTPQSHGCIRQWLPDARALWEFAPVGTTVVVVA